MHLSFSLAVGLAYSAVAQSIYGRTIPDDIVPLTRAAAAPLDAPAVANLLKDIESSTKKLNTAISKITKSNVKTQLDAIVAEAKSMNNVLKKHSTSVKASKPFANIAGLTQLQTPATSAVSAIIQMVTLIVEKRPIVLEAKMESKVKEALMASKSGVTALIQALPSQVSMKGATAQQISATLTAANIGKLYDGLIDMVMGLFSSSSQMPDLSALLGKAGGKGGMPDLSALLGKAGGKGGMPDLSALLGKAGGKGAKGGRN